MKYLLKNVECSSVLVCTQKHFIDCIYFSLTIQLEIVESIHKYMRFVEGFRFEDKLSTTN